MSIQTVLDENRLVRYLWYDADERGRHLLCLYTALVGDPNGRPETCPASVAPRWLAHLLPWFDDACSATHWPEVVRRVARLAPRFGEIKPAVNYRCRAVAVREARRHVSDHGGLAAIDGVLAVLDRAGRGEVAAPAEWRRAADRAAAEATWAAWAAVGTAGATAAAWAAEAARAVAARAEAAGEAADRIIDGMLDEIEASLKEAS